MACFLPFRPFRLWALGFSVPRGAVSLAQDGFPLLYFSAASAFSSQSRRPPTCVLRRPKAAFGKRLAEASRPCSISGSTGPFVRRVFRTGVPRALPCSREGTPSGLATRLTCLSTHTSLEAYFSSQRSWASPFRAFLPSGGRHGVSPGLSALALSYKTSRPCTGAPAVLSPLRSRPPLRYPEG